MVKVEAHVLKKGAESIPFGCVVEGWVVCVVFFCFVVFFFPFFFFFPVFNF